MNLKTNLTEEFGIMEGHRSSNIDIASVTDQSPPRRAFAAQNTAVVQKEWSEINLQQVRMIRAVLHTTRNCQSLVETPPIVLRVDWCFPHF